MWWVIQARCECTARIFDQTHSSSTTFLIISTWFIISVFKSLKLSSYSKPVVMNLPASYIGCIQIWVSVQISTISSTILSKSGHSNRFGNYFQIYVLQVCVLLWAFTNDFWYRGLINRWMPDYLSFSQRVIASEVTCYVDLEWTVPLDSHADGFYQHLKGGGKSCFSCVWWWC